MDDFEEGLQNFESHWVRGYVDSVLKEGGAIRKVVLKAILIFNNAKQLIHC